MIDPKEFRPDFIKEELPENLEQRYCVQCSTPLSKFLKYYCSGTCLLKAKEDGTYGNEEVNSIDI